MAQGTQCLHAICNYMRKVKLKYQHVHPVPPTLHINAIYFVCFPLSLLKQSRSSKPIKEFFFPFYTPDESLCPVKALQVYKNYTAPFRTGESKSTLFLSWIGRWLQTCLQEGGVDTDTFKAHSVRGAACSSAAWSGVTTTDILNAADW